MAAGDSKMKGLVWFRRDLRVQDQPALAAASKDCREVLPLFVFDEPLLRSKTFGSACVTFMLECLQDLAASLADRGLQLHWRRGDPVDEVVKAARHWQVEAVYWNRDYEPAALERDRLVAQALGRYGIEVRTFKDHVIFEPDEIRSASNGPLQRYGAYRKRWWARWREAAPAILPAPRLGSNRKVRPQLNKLPDPADLGYARLDGLMPGGETAGRRRLAWFLRGPIRDYGIGRNRPAVDGSSMLSPHFRFGTVSPRSAAQAALEALRRRGTSWRTGITTWVDELVWRDFFQQVLANFPRVADEPFRQENWVPPRRNTQQFRAWCEGRTGFPLVDAGMRQLNETGWMHNRVRMVVASFLVKDLLLDWRLGERYFMDHLLDADLAANNGNWQWCASTGTDAMPGYRIFNPVLQAKKFDPQGEYIRRYVPELKSVPAPSIFQPDAMSPEHQARCGCRIGKDYPKPIVDHQRAREEYLARSRRKK